MTDVNPLAPTLCTSQRAVRRSLALLCSFCPRSAGTGRWISASLCWTTEQTHVSYLGTISGDTGHSGAHWAAAPTSIPPGHSHLIIDLHVDVQLLWFESAQSMLPTCSETVNFSKMLNAQADSDCEVDYSSHELPPNRQGQQLSDVEQRF